MSPPPASTTILLLLLPLLCECVCVRVCRICMCTKLRSNARRVFGRIRVRERVRACVTLRRAYRVGLATAHSRAVEAASFVVGAARNLSSMALMREYWVGGVWVPVESAEKKHNRWRQHLHQYHYVCGCVRWALLPPSLVGVRPPPARAARRHAPAPVAPATQSPSHRSKGSSGSTRNAKVAQSGSSIHNDSTRNATVALATVAPAWPPPPPRTTAFSPSAVLSLPPATTQKLSLHMFWLPPPTTQKGPVQTFSSPPPIVADSPSEVMVFDLPPETVDFDPPAVL
jgi:hypothetical protein